MATPLQSTTTSRSHNISSLTIYAVALSILSAITVSFVFYLSFGLLDSIVTFVLYSLALVGVYGCKPLIEVVCYPRYGSLSERRKCQVDEVRVTGVKRLLEGVTMNDDYDDEEEHGGIAVVLQLYKMDEEDITSSSASSFSVDTESAETEYTHVRIPCPGMMQLQRPSSTTTESTTTRATKDDNTVSH
eukprot:scaffold26046_cov158-Skeletonema_marinoi.AAC.2